MTSPSYMPRLERRLAQSEPRFHPERIACSNAFDGGEQRWSSNQAAWRITGAVVLAWAIIGVLLWWGLS